MKNVKNSIKTIILILSLVLSVNSTYQLAQSRQVEAGITQYELTDQNGEVSANFLRRT